MTYNKQIPYSVNAIRTVDAMNKRTSSALTDTSFMHKEDAMLFARQLSVYTDIAIVFNQMTGRKIAEYKEGKKV